MFRLLRWTALVLAFGSAANVAQGFSLLGPLAAAPWQTTALGYNPGGTDLGGPMNLGEEYRWNTRTITYGFDKSFLDYFGKRGVEEVKKAVSILNRLPPVSKMSPTLSEFPQDSRGINHQAMSLVLRDMKSTVLSALLAELGLATPERYVWTLRNRITLTPPATNYYVVMRNFDPVTLIPSPYVNGVLYSYQIAEFENPNYSDAVETLVDPLALPLTSVATGPVTFGMFFTGLTRDDVGGLRYLYSRSNLNVENPLPTATLATSVGSPWGPPGIPGVPAGLMVATAVRPGVEKITLQQLNYYGIFLPVTNRYVDLYVNITNNQTVSQRLERILTVPDITFSAGDLGTDALNGSPFITRQTDASAWINNAAINNNVIGGNITISGPGTIVAPTTIALTTVGPHLVNINPGFLPGQAEASQVFGGWAAFDGTTNAPFVFPNGATIQELERRIMNAGL